MQTFGARVRSATERANALLATRGAEWALLTALAALYVVAYASDEMNPGAATAAARTGWWSWHDQWRYALSAEALAQGRVDAETYFYPLGYPALGALFVRVMPAQLFFWPNLACVLLTAMAAWRLARRWMSPVATLALAVGFIATHATTLRLTMVIPWNTLPLQAALVGGLWLVHARRDGAAVAWLSLIAAAAYWVRPADAACLAPLLVFATLRLPTWRERLVWGTAGALLVAASVALMAWVTWRTFGDWRTPYERSSVANIGFFAYPLAQKLYWLLVDGETFFGEYHTALLWRFPWLFAVIPGAVWWWRREGGAALAGLATLAASATLYVGYNDFFPSGLIRFSLIHYVTWAFVPLVLVAGAALLDGWRGRGVRVAAGVMAAVFVLALGLKLKERALPAAMAAGEVRQLPAARPLWVEFPGENRAALGTLRLDGRVLVESRDFQIPYATEDARVLLSERARGARLTSEGGRLRAMPVTGDFTWSWWPRWRRLSAAWE